MTTTSIGHIYKDYRKDHKGTPSFMIDFYNEHFIFLNNIKSFSDSEELSISTN
ncbi:MAG: hypothetical protein ABI199_08475 [Bacteroidia bacterium]